MAALSSFFVPDAKLAILPRLAISLEALDKRGKTHYALSTAPDPLVVVSNDTGTAEVYRKLKAKGRRLNLIQQEIEKPDIKIIKRDDIDRAEHAIWKKEWTRHEQIVDAIGSDKTIRTVVWDNATDLANLCELAYFGKLRGNARIDIRAEYNAAFTRWFWELYKGRPDLNIILIHKLKKQYAKNSKGEDAWNGKYERSGFTNMGFLVDLCVRCGWDTNVKDFYTELDPDQPTRYETANTLMGKRWYSRAGESGFGLLGLDVFPDTALTPEIWGL